MTSSPSSVFRLPDDLSAKAAPALTAADDAHFAAIAATLRGGLADASAQWDAVRASALGVGGAAVERDLEAHRLGARVEMLRRYDVDMCLGRMVTADGARIYIGRLGLTGADGTQLLVDWRALAAEPFFGATHADPMGLVSRRRYRWTGGHIVDYWDEAFTAEGLAAGGALDEQSSFIASLGASRSPRMRDVLATIQSDQDAVIRASSAGALVVDGGPGTGKTVVALHRAAYLLYADARLARGSGGVLVVGPHEPYLAYVDDVLPSLGEDRVQTCTLRDLVPGGADLPAETDAAVARVKADGRLVDAVAAAVRLYERPPQHDTVVETPWGDLHVRAGEWAEAFEIDTDSPHDDARDEVWNALLDIVLDRFNERLPRAALRRALVGDEQFLREFDRAWPVLDPAALVALLWTDAAFLRRCAPWLSDAEAGLLQRADGAAWTASDLPVLDAARLRIGDPGGGRIRRERERMRTAERVYRADVAEYFGGASDGDDMGLMSMLRGDDLRNSLDDDAGLPELAHDPLTGPFAHIIVDEAQELSDAEWRMLRARCPSGSFTIVGDRAQARAGFAETWQERLERVGIADVRVAHLTLNYRTPAEIMAAAEPVILAAIPDANVPTSVRTNGMPVRHEPLAERDAIIRDWLAVHDEGTACVIGDETFAGIERVRSLTPQTAKGLEFDLVLLADPDGWGGGVAGAVDRYVAMTRATSELVVLESEGLAARDRQDRAGGVRRIGLREIDVCAREFGWLARPAQGCVCAERAHPLIAPARARNERCPDRSRCDGIDTDAAGPGLLGERADERHLCGFRHGVVDEPG